jgi:protein SCO1/2
LSDRDRGSRKTRWIPVAVLAAWACSGPAPALPSSGGTAGQAGPGITEHAGDVIPADIAAVDESGAAVRLIDLMDRPVILALVYYTCEHVCPLVLGALGQLASDLPLRPGLDYRLVTLSFDAADTPGAAATARANYTKPLGRAFPAGAWTFLTAPAKDIDRLTGALGFRFERAGHGFIHPSVLVVLGPGGRISRYVHVSRTAYGVGYPVTFVPSALAETLRQAGAGGPGGKDAAPVLFCYPGEPPAQSRFYGLMRAMGVGTLVLMAAFFVYVSALWKRPRPGAGGG